MSIVNSIATYGQEGFQLYQTIGQQVRTGALTVTVPSSGSISPAVTRGLWRVKVYNPGGTSPSITSVTITALDATNTVTIDNFVPTASITITGTAWVDVMGDFIVDTGVASNGGAAGAMIFGGATSFNFVFVQGGTSPTYSVDAEIAAAP
jgi:hypothetical protein